MRSGSPRTSSTMRTTSSSAAEGTAEEAMTEMRGMMSKLKLTVNETKTRLCHLPDESFDFLGYTLGRNYRLPDRQVLSGTESGSRKKIDRLCREIGELTTRKKAGRDVGDAGGDDQPQVKGWSNYFRIGTVSKAYRTVNSHVRHRVRQWLCVKFKVRGKVVRTRFHGSISAPEAGIIPASTNVAATRSWANV